MFTLVGFLVGNSNKGMEKTISRGARIAVAAVVALVVWRVRQHRTNKRTEAAEAA